MGEGKVKEGCGLWWDWREKMVGPVSWATLKGLAQFRELWDDSKAFKQKKKIPFKTFLSVYSGEWIVL